MNTIKLLQVFLDMPLGAAEISAFRKAVAQKAGYEFDVYHNHEENGKCIHRYPLVQYKRKQKNASLLFITEKAIEDAHELFKHSDWTLNIAGEPRKMRIENLDLRQYNLELADKPIYKYRLFSWLALNQENHQQYLQQNSLVDKIALLKKILIGNILSFAQNMEWTIDQQIELEITDFYRQKHTTYKDTTFLAFDLAFCTNVALPNYIGLGKAVSHGFGTIYPYRKKGEQKVGKVEKMKVKE